MFVQMDARPLGVLDGHESIAQANEAVDAFETVEIIVGAIPRREEAIVLPSLPQDPGIIPRSGGPAGPHPGFGKYSVPPTRPPPLHIGGEGAGG